VLSFVFYSWAIWRTFSRAYGVDWRMKMLQTAGTVSALIHLTALAVATIGLSRGGGALLLYGAGLLVFLAARRAIASHQLTLAFSPDVPTQLVSSGIYTQVRHPFYLAYSLAWLAGLVGGPSVWTLVTTIAMVGAYVHAARIEETKFQASPLAASYDAYRTRAGMFAPRPQFKRRN